MGDYGAHFQVFRHLTVGDQHGHFDCNIPDGVSHSNTQNRDSRALHLKLDELLRGVKEARTGLVNLEEMPEEDLERLTNEFKRLKRRQTASTAGEHEIARTAADPSIVAGAAAPGGCRRTTYLRWHGSPRIYYSLYEDAAPEGLANQILNAASSGQRRVQV